jgi:hypothetical protein
MCRSSSFSPPNAGGSRANPRDLFFTRPTHAREWTAWLPFLDTYRTMCRAPEPAFRQVLEDIRELRFG